MVHTEPLLQAWHWISTPVVLDVIETEAGLEAPSVTGCLGEWSEMVHMKGLSTWNLLCSSAGQ